MRHTVHVTDDVVTAAVNLAPDIRAARDELEAIRQVPASLAQAMADAGLFQLYLPRAMGGPELPPLTAFHAIEALSKVDGSVGWVAMIASTVSLFTGWLPTHVGRAMFGQPPDVRIAGSIRPEGKAYVVDGGYRVQGRWDFASGITHANWLFCTCIIMDGDRLRHTPAGTPELRHLFVPAEAASIEDTWSVVGMCGTGSHDFIVDDVFVPTSRTLSLADPPYAGGPLYHPRLFLVAGWANTAANALGIARGALDAFTALATTRGSTYRKSKALFRSAPLTACPCRRPFSPAALAALPARRGRPPERPGARRSTVQRGFG